VNPPAGFVAAVKQTAAGGPPPAAAICIPPGQMLRMPVFYLLWVLYFIGSGAGLMVISSVSGMAKKSMGTAAFVAVAVMAIGNAAGRVVAGMVSDRIGRRWTLMLVLLFQAALMFIAIPVTQSDTVVPFVVVLVATLIGFNYGANLSLFPSFTKDLWGLKTFGMNYGILFTSWGVGGFVLSRLQQMLKAGSGNYISSFITAGLLLIVGGLLTLLVKPPRPPAPAKG
jgi:MFS transporter, OFA family, oxalate/formate antiporter